MTGVIIRILLRYLAAALVARGLITTDLGAALAGDVEIATVLEVAVGTGIGVVVEGWYFLARKMGWAT